MTPLVTICLPVRDARPFLPERIDSILAQTWPHWELLVLDGESTDGSWEYLQARLKDEPRARLHRAPPDGIYAAMNACVALAAGDFIYFAMADDTMEPRCLEVLTSLATSSATPCVAQCGLTVIDEHSRPIPDDRQFPHTTESHEEGALDFNQPHVRPAPLDGALVLTFGTVITSLTQALFPREVFARVGPFPTQFGSAGDMGWEGVLGFLYDTKYSAERLATWRHHAAQATRSPENEAVWLRRRPLIGDWIIGQIGRHDPRLREAAEAARLGEYYRFWQVRGESRHDRSLMPRLRTIARMLASCPHFYLAYLIARLRRLLGLSHADAVTSTRLRGVDRFLAHVR